jgi:hypothetical protein
MWFHLKKKEHTPHFSPDVAVLNKSGCFGSKKKMLQVTLASWKPASANPYQVASPHNRLVS